jgi:hypothetical protein
MKSGPTHQTTDTYRLDTVTDSVYNNPNGEEAVAFLEAAL